MAVYRIGRGADPLPVSATFDPSDQPGCRSLLDWFERGAPSGAVLLVDDWALCAGQDPGLERTVEWVAAFGPRHGVQVVVTARKWSDLPARLRRYLHGEPTDFLALHGIEADLSTMWQRRDYRAAVGVDERGWPVYFEMSIEAGAHGLSGTYLGPRRGEHLRATLLGLMVTHSPDDLQFVLIDGAGTGVFGTLPDAPHVAHMIGNGTTADIVDRLVVGLQGELARRQDLIHTQGRPRNSWEYRAERDAGADLEPLADLLICADSPGPEFHDVLTQLIRVGKTLGVRVLISGDEYPEELPVRLPAWPTAALTHDFAEMEQVLPQAMRGGAVPHQIMLPPLEQSGEVTLDMVPDGAVGIIDNVYEQRRDALYLACNDDYRYGAFVGAPGTGKSTAMRTLAHALGPDLPGYQLLDGPGEPIDRDRYVVVTARTWAEVPRFMLENLAFGIEFRLDDPSASLVDARMAARVPRGRPGIGLSAGHKVPVRIAVP
jgi:hypothetical protein